ncbi:type II toxin-antitoxin system HicA family toxin [Polynucleobacter sp. es-GGE-1]|uniref:Type II toxin-antitoxin system HicA family toxin n=1 Tax=Polynucleobacter campilacus TaxID=1743163 RepID=A0A254PUY8_9BURK|nr:MULTISPECIES: hypothetical protein [Polynucleobacter]MBU3635787.1 type II toxin-antitoxin system HicA family toxin [Polynucleobacter sp. es-GGE-1]MEA9599125.1 hypothetical protein [Polynucleobacter sp. AP-Sanab-80-C2]OWS69106.1 hypothetical protein CBI31_08520 [Polynucleobacter campilacus]
MAKVIGSYRGNSFSTDLVAILKEAGCHYHAPAHRGNHDIWFSPVTSVYFPLDSKILSHHTANAVLKIAGLPEQFEAHQDEDAEDKTE